MVLTLFDWYCASYGLLMVAFCELIAINWFYGKILHKDDLVWNLKKVNLCHLRTVHAQISLNITQTSLFK